MRCEKCGSALRALFLTTYCERCEEPIGDRRGWIVFRGRPPGSTEYVFRTRRDADRWAAHAGYTKHTIRSVRTASPVEWTASTGVLADVTLAKGAYEIYPDEGYEHVGRRAHLEPI